MIGAALGAGPWQGTVGGDVVVPSQYANITCYMVPPEVVGGLATTEGKVTWFGKVGGKVVDAGAGETAAGPILCPKIAMISRGEPAEPPVSTGSNPGVPFQIADFWTE